MHARDVPRRQETEENILRTPIDQLDTWPYLTSSTLKKTQKYDLEKVTEEIFNEYQKDHHNSEKFLAFLLGGNTL